MRGEDDGNTYLQAYYFEGERIPHAVVGARRPDFDAFLNKAESHKLRTVFLSTDQPAPIRTAENPDKVLCIRINRYDCVTQIFIPPAPNCVI